MAQVTIAKKEYILEVEVSKEDTLEVLSYSDKTSGYFLRTTKPKWIFPFIENFIVLPHINTPNHTMLLMKGIEDEGYNVSDAIGKQVISIRSRRLVPFKLNTEQIVAVLYLVPTIEAHVVIEN